MALRSTSYHRENSKVKKEKYAYKIDINQLLTDHARLQLVRNLAVILGKKKSKNPPKNRQHCALSLSKDLFKLSKENKEKKDDILKKSVEISLWFPFEYNELEVSEDYIAYPASSRFNAMRPIKAAFEFEGGSRSAEYLASNLDWHLSWPSISEEEWIKEATELLELLIKMWDLNKEEIYAAMREAGERSEMDSSQKNEEFIKQLKMMGWG